MSSVQDVADQINAKLDAIGDSTSATASSTAATVVEVKKLETKVDQTNTTLQKVDGDINLGFANIGAGLLAILEVDRAVLATLAHQVEQNDTMICLLQNADELLCGITRKLSRQIALEERSVRASERIEGILERVHCCQAAEYDRQVDIEVRMAECCPPPEQPLEPCPAPCSTRPFREHKPTDQDWKPLPPPKQQPAPR